MGPGGYTIGHVRSHKPYIQAGAADASLTVWQRILGCD